jgi:hypothetical protein
MKEFHHGMLAVVDLADVDHLWACSRGFHPDDCDEMKSAKKLLDEAGDLFSSIFLCASFVCPSFSRCRRPTISVGACIVETGQWAVVFQICRHYGI